MLGNMMLDVLPVERPHTRILLKIRIRRLEEDLNSIKRRDDRLSLYPIYPATHPNSSHPPMTVSTTILP